jgi:hypothetical protein
MDHRVLESMPKGVTEMTTTINWEAAGRFSDIIYEKAEGIAKITINRPDAERLSTLDGGGDVPSLE